MPNVEPSLLIGLRKTQPCATLRELAAQTGVSRQRVHQLLAREGQPTRHQHQYKHLCAVCGKRLTRTPTTGRCRRCQKAYNRADIPCAECGKLVSRRLAQIVNNARCGGHGRVFCDRVCFGRWIGKNKGFRAHPEISRLRRLPITLSLRALQVGEALRVPCPWKHTQGGCVGHNWLGKQRRELDWRLTASCREGTFTVTRLA